MKSPTVEVTIKGRTYGDMSRKPLKDIKKLLTDGFTVACLDGMGLDKYTVEVRVKRSAGKRAKVKGKSYEDKIGKILGEWWWGKPFRHSPGSGAWDKQTNDGQILAPGDLVIPKEANCKLIVECKKRKEFPKKFAGFYSLWDWWNKLRQEAVQYSRVPLLVFSEDNGIDYVAFDGFIFMGDELYDLEVLSVQDGRYTICIAVLKEFLSRVENDDLRDYFVDKG